MEASASMANASSLLSSSLPTKRRASALGSGTSGNAGAWYQVPELNLRDHRFEVPLNYAAPSDSTISVFAREVVSVGNEEKDLPFLLFLQGGPGFESLRPLECSGWLKRACEDFRVILLDQRGTGLSTALTVGSLNQLSSPQAQASYLQHFRADNIVRDAEMIRKSLVPHGEPWTLLGQSYGGFCAVTYLSMAPSGLEQVLLTGGLPPIDAGCTAEAVYRACYKRVLLQNMKFYQRFPRDEELVREIVLHLASSEGGGVLLPSGGKLTPRSFQLLGLTGLGSHTGFEKLHFTLERAWDPVLVPGISKQLSYTFLRAFENWLDFDTNPLYALMHEPIYCQGAASNWAAQKVRDELDEQFDPVFAAKHSEPVLFTGEMVYPWIFDEIKPLHPLKEAANLLAEKQDWPVLYNHEVLRSNKVPVAAAVYYEDMYVNVSLSEATAASIPGIRLWITNEFMHSGLREDGYRVLDHLLAMLKGKRLLR
ncbi:uncharacterized protein LOC9644930 [Selaginella moellendorffii]|uniref:uncharacterized protein LOC9644930 n=1 Tax=Selaginella moellendorffii TaxID=88036 RepID=UPI000D1CD579|nr:uncharacterized protein LOC9644930 [Selaginella moellendorffii]|eukprot:XP_002984144.2 uncharacterized protein LOC9644930 [Selaginella moellendorffii]